MWYFSDIQFPKSKSLHRSLQKGRKGLSLKVVSFPHRGHWIFIVFKSQEEFL
jgi:hypothetical protein